MEIFNQVKAMFSKEEQERQQEQERLRKERGSLSRDFLNSEFFTKYLFPYMDEARIVEYPSTKKRGWEDAYRTARARDEVFTEIMNTIQSWQREGAMVEAKQKETPKDIINA